MVATHFEISKGQERLRLGVLNVLPRLDFFERLLGVLRLRRGGSAKKRRRAMAVLDRAIEIRDEAIIIPEGHKITGLPNKLMMVADEVR